MAQENDNIFSSRFIFDSLYCQEGSLIHNTQKCFLEEEEVDSSYVVSFTCEEEQEQDLTCLLTREEQFQICNGFENSGFLRSRAEMVEWILRVVGLYSFSAQTALLAVNHLDRFLHTFKDHQEKPWMIQLAAIACLSLAAKVEETHVPLLLDLQVGSKLVFEPKTIQRMEILVLSTLQWKMNSVTPIQFLHYIARKLGFKGVFFRDFLRRCESLLFSVLSDCRFIEYLPSTLATATMLHVLGNLQPFAAVNFHGELISILGVSNSRERVEACCDLILEAVIKPNPHKRKYTGAFPDSPTGVFDVSFSSDNGPPQKKIEFALE